MRFSVLRSGYFVFPCCHLLILCALILSGCADEAAGTDQPDASDRTDAGRDTGSRLGPGEACVEDGECLSRVCVRFDEADEEGFCSEFCLDDRDCPFSEWICVLIQLEEGELAQVCLPENYCVDIDEDRYGIGPGCAGPDCDDDDDQSNPEADEVCDGADNDCDGNVDENPIDANAGCFTGLGGVCSEGISICLEGELICEGLMGPSEEVCDALDNDCDGLTDADPDGTLLSAPCYGGTEESLGVGVCHAGVRECKSGVFGECQGELLPSLEACDGLDNDCDGSTDEDDPGGGRPCETDLPGLCARGLTSCSATGELVCVPADAEDEVCDGVDNDCDGDVDEDEDGDPLSRACYNGPDGTLEVGVCRAGSQVCEDGEYGPCEGEVQPLPELCDRLDNNCDGRIDEDVLGGGFPCDTGAFGVCASGISRCDETGSFCDPMFTAVEEFCDGLDNDCDGAVDENALGNPLTRDCYEGPSGTLGVGICVSGTSTCAGGELGPCNGQVLPTAEICDGLNNDCDADGADEGNPQGGFLCSTGLSGVCSVGTTVCVAGAEPPIQCVPDVEPFTLPELCDGLDNDCDGVVDDGFADLGELCFSGQGICARVGVIICDPVYPTADPVCSAEPGTPAAVEACDNTDDDCDGEIDEDFKNYEGIYNQLVNCGACGVDCNQLWLPDPTDPTDPHVIPTCQVSGGAASCSFDCVAGYEDADGIEDNGCEFEPDSDAVYVSTPGSGGEDTPDCLDPDPPVPCCGAWNDPCGSISFGIDVALDAGVSQVVVSNGVYTETVELENGIDVLGGHNSASWTWDPEVNVTIIRGRTEGSTDPDRMAVVAANITLSTELSGFVIEAENGAAGGNSIGVYVVDSDENLLIRDNVILGGPGGDGETGDYGTPGFDGVDAGDGLEAEYHNQECNASFDLPGGAGGHRECVDPLGVTTDVSGGAGGTSTCPVFNVPNGSGEDGLGEDPGTGGRGGASMDGKKEGFVRECRIGSNPTDARPGTPGTKGGDGDGGDGAVDEAGSVETDEMQWRGEDGSPGEHGTHGSGGGGGGAGPGVHALQGKKEYYGASGGGGGSGGCAGFAAGGGGAGGGSFAVFMAFTDIPTGADVMPQLIDNRLVAGDGGAGGEGGVGGAGGDASRGGAGGDSDTVDPDLDFAFCLEDGGRGGVGGRGGHGGGGGGGGGGVSFDVYVWNSEGLDPGYTGLNDFEVDPDIGVGGPGGAGGTSSNPLVGTGDDGVAGDFGEVGLASPLP